METTKTYTLAEVKAISKDLLSIGMDVRQQQLQGYCGKSGNDAHKEYFDELEKKENLIEEKPTKTIILTFDVKTDKDYDDITTATKKGIFRELDNRRIASPTDIIIHTCQQRVYDRDNL